MTPFIHMLTVVAVLVHSTLGCCAHQAHDTSDTCCEPSDCCGSEHCGSEQDSLKHADHSDKSQSKESRPTVPHECSHASCKFSVPESRSCADLMSLDAANSIQWTSTVSFVFVLGNGIDSPNLLPDISRHTMPVRTHLAKSVLLI
ncbi:MAG: hypothetical protein GXP26_06545 [Planctomycetes bacterium]|nr:hypothetical protein [Planctomycetota bacterium]